MKAERGGGGQTKKSFPRNLQNPNPWGRWKGRRGKSDKYLVGLVSLIFLIFLTES